MRPETAADVEHWNLTNAEQVAYFGRVAAYWGRRARAHGERSDRLLRLAGKLWRLTGALWIGVVLLLLAKILGY